MKLLDRLLAKATGTDAPAASTPRTGPAASLSIPTDVSEREILRSIDCLLAPHPVPGGGWEGSGLPGVEPSTLVVLAPDGALEHAERSALLDLCKRYDAAVENVSKYSRTMIKVEFERRQAEAAARIGRGESAAAPNRDDLDTEFGAARQAGRRTVREIAGEAAALLGPIAARLEVAVWEAVDRELLAEFFEYQRLGLKFTPSERTRTLYAVRAALRRARERLAQEPRGSYGTNPRAQCASLGIQL